MADEQDRKSGGEAAPLDVMAKTIGPLMPTEYCYYTPKEIAQETLRALSKAGYAVVPLGVSYVFENCRVENGVVVGPADPTKPYRYPRGHENVFSLPPDSKKGE